MARQLGIFVTQWGLMILGFGILTRLIAPVKLLGSNFFLGSYIDAGLKALIALGFSIIWLFLWDRQVRFYFYRNRK